MRWHRKPHQPTIDQPRDGGFTLVELLVSIVVGGIMASSMAAALITSVNVSGGTATQVSDTNDAQLISAFLVRDAQSAGGSNPATGLRDPAIGVIVPAALSCGTGTPLVELRWNEHLSKTKRVYHVAAYSRVAATNEMVRTKCETLWDNGVSSTYKPQVSVTIARGVAAAVARCDGSSCPTGSPSLPRQVSLTVTESSASAYSFIVTATVRADNQNVLGGGSSAAAAAPMIALGGSCPALSGLELQGSNGVKFNVNGRLVVNTTDSGSCQAIEHTGNANYHATGGTWLAPGASCEDNFCPQPVYPQTAPIEDPFAGLTVAGAGTCNVAPLTSPARVGTVYQPGVYKGAVPPSGATYAPGAYVFCHDVNLTNVTATGVLFYFDNGSDLQLGSGNSDSNVAGGYEANGFVYPAIWRTGAQELDFKSCGACHYGITYAPDALVDFGTGSPEATFLALIARSFFFGGSPDVTVGLPVAFGIVTSAMPSARLNLPYSSPVEARGGTVPYTWALTAGSLPPGLTLAASGVISGTPTTLGSYPFTVRATDAVGAADTRSLVFLVESPSVTITAPASLPVGIVGSTYPATSLTVVGGTGPYTWGSTGLPAGLALGTASGQITGVPTTAGTFTVTVSVADATGAATFRAYNLTVNPALTITSPAALDDWTVGRPYTAVTATAAGGSGTRTWSATGLPPGLTINATTGDISGTPTAAGSYSYTIRVTDSVGTTATLAGNVTINPVLAISTASLPNWTFNRPYTPVTLTTSGGTGAVTWSATNLPTGLSLSAAGTLTGTPTATGTRTVNVTATDSTGSIANRSYTMVISVAPAISTASLPNWTANRAYTTAVVATGGTTAYTWSATGMPPGLSINSGSGVISGNPTTPGAYSVNVIVTDAAGATANRTYPVTINAGLQVSAPLFLSDWTVNRAYTSVTFNATGGTGTKTWSASGLPTGLAINAGGVLTGTPTAVGSYPYTVTVTDAAGATAQMSGTVFINPALSVTAPASLPNWTAGLAYLPVTMSSSGGTGTVSWSASGLPAGLTISTAGVISGTPTATGPFTATITATDFVGATAPRSYTFTVNPALNISTATLPAGTVGRPYSQALSSTGGTGAKTWSGSGLPTGLSINAAGVISGTPTVAGTFGSISVTVTDTVGATTVKGFSVTIYTAPTISAPAALPNGSSGLAYSSTATATGGSGVYTWSATGLPPGLTMAATGQISGTPTTSGSYTVTVTVTDSTTLATANMVYNNVAITPRVTNVVLTGGNGIASTNDSVVITLSEAVNPATLCAGWDGTSRSVTVTISGTDMLTVSGCTTLGTLALGGDYVTTTATFSGNGGNASTIAWSAATNTVTITLGKLNTGAVNGIAVPPGTPTYTPNAAMTTASGVPFGTTPFTPAASSRF